MILSHKEIEEIAAAVTKDFNEFFFGPDTDGRRLPRGTPIDQFAREYLGLNVSFAYLSEDGSICGLTAYTRYRVHRGGQRLSAQNPAAPKRSSDGQELYRAFTDSQALREKAVYTRP